MATRTWISPVGVRGQTLVEFAFILALVVLLCLAALAVIGRETAEPINQMANAMP